MFPWNMFSPFKRDQSGMMNGMNPKDIDQYVQGMMKQMIPKEWQGIMNPQEMMKNGSSFMGDMNSSAGGNSGENQKQPAQIQANVFETFEDVFIRIKLPSEELATQMRVFHTSNQAIIENIPELGERQVITLPSLVKKKGSTAQYKDGILEIKIPKSVDMQYTEVDVSEKY
ncbi:Hsp20/alpha crystallin family protein [Rossellomorea sp. BNER]|uniref:Hsp20/alpha crystallin family protein n=1 Tax=Rossellomorea sp. BNER TaxID=2962031 RepID=UPI003AF2124A|nr:Hsp20/alpha crystallin family protein [Rossellomorea sp. BNER]